MDIGASFTYMFEDKDWIKKILIGSVVALIPIVNFAAFGYVIQIIRNVRDGQSLPLPEWDQFGQYFMDGLWVFLIILVWSIPFILAVCVIVGASLTENEDLVGIVVTCFGCLAVLWGLLVSIFIPAILLRFAEVGEFVAGFRFGEVFGVITADVGNYVIVLLLIWVANSIIAPLGIILCVVGVIFTQFWSYLVAGNLVGQLAAQHQASEPAV